MIMTVLESVRHAGRDRELVELAVDQRDDLATKSRGEEKNLRGYLCFKAGRGETD